MQRPWQCSCGCAGVPYQGVDMTEHLQYVTVRNERGRKMLETIRDVLEEVPATSSGSRGELVMQTLLRRVRAEYGCMCVSL